MSQGKKCIFVTGRECHFKSAQIPLQTCQLCIEAWKTEISLKKQMKQRGQVRPVESEQKVSPLPVSASGEGASVFYNEKLKQIDELLLNEKIDPMEYVKLRKQHIESLLNQSNMGRKSNLAVNEEKKPTPRPIRVAVIVKTLFGNQIYTSPEGWELPEAISNKVINKIFQLAKTKNPLKLGAGDYKLVCFLQEKTRIALMIIDMDEEFETYEHEIERVKGILNGEKLWALGVKKINN